MFEISSPFVTVSRPFDIPALYCPAGANRRLPSVLKLNRRKKESRASLWYRYIDFGPCWAFGDEDGFTAGRGNAGDGDADRRNAEMEDCAGDPENEDRRLEEKGGGFIGIDIDVGVPGVEGVGEGATSYP